MKRELSNITFNSSLITRIFEAVRVEFIDRDGATACPSIRASKPHGAPTPRIKRGRIMVPLEFSGRTKILIGLVGVRDREITTRAIDAHTLRCDGAMVEHSECLLAPFRIGEPLAGGRGCTLTECCITKILSERVIFRNKNRPPAAGNRVHASTPSRGAYDPGTNRRQISGATRWQKSRRGRSRAQRDGGASGNRGDAPCRFLSRPFGCVSVGISGVGRLNRMSAFRRPIPYLPRRKRNAGRMEMCEMRAKLEEIRSIFK